MASSPLASRIGNPARELDPTALAEAWFQQTVVLRIAGAARAAEHPGLLNKLRGSLGNALMKGASVEAAAGRPCPWQPACAFDVLFREQARFEGRHGVPKPWTVAADRAGLDLDLRLTLFGFACDWADSVRERLAEAVRSNLPWRFLLGPGAPERSEIRSSRIETLKGLRPVPAPEAVVLHFITGVDAAGSDPRDDPATLVARLARRIDGLARWQDAAIPAASWEVLAELWRHLHYSAGFTEGLHRRYSRRQGRAIRNADLAGRLEISGCLDPVWPLLRLGEHVHIGRGATAGRGRYRLLRPDGIAHDSRDITHTDAASGPQKCASG